MLLTNYVRYIDTQKFQFFTWFTNRSVLSLMCNLIMLQHLMKEKKEWMRNHLPSIFILTNKIVEGFFYFFRSRLFLDMQLPTRYIKRYISYINLRSLMILIILNSWINETRLEHNSESKNRLLHLSSLYTFYVFEYFNFRKRYFIDFAIAIIE